MLATIFLGSEGASIGHTSTLRISGEVLLTLLLLLQGLCSENSRPSRTKNTAGLRLTRVMTLYVHLHYKLRCLIPFQVKARAQGGPMEYITYHKDAVRPTYLLVIKKRK